MLELQFQRKVKVTRAAAVSQNEWWEQRSQAQG